jgi:hypothetical protein
MTLIVVLVGGWFLLRFVRGRFLRLIALVVGAAMIAGVNLGPALGGLLKAVLGIPVAG